MAFLREVGATLVLRERVPLVGEEREYAILVLGGVRMLLFETVVFEGALVAGGVQPGLPMPFMKWTTSTPSTHAFARSAPRS